MEYHDIYNLSIKDTYFYNSHASYIGLLKKHGINTVGQLLDNKDIVNIARDASKEQLKTLISLCEYEYMGKKLGKDRVLGRRIIKLALEPGGFTIYIADNNYKHFNYNLESFLEKFLGVPKGSLYGVCKKIVEDTVIVGSGAPKNFAQSFFPITAFYVQRVKAARKAK